LKKLHTMMDDGASKLTATTSHEHDMRPFSTGEYGTVSEDAEKSKAPVSEIEEKKDEIEKQGYQANVYDVDWSGNVPRFDVTESVKWQAYLQEHGYVVLKGILTKDQVTELRGDVYDWLESHPETTFKRGDPSTWDKIIVNKKNGIVGQNGAGQADHMWKIRGNQRVIDAFATIWGTDDLLTSFTGFNVFRPWGYKPEWKTNGGWFHVDQNGGNPERRGFQCVQGLVNLFDVTDSTGGLTVIPKSHIDFEGLVERQETWVKAFRGDFIPLQKTDPFFKKPYVKKVLLCKAGDICLWDSRTVHCSTPALREKEKPAGGWELLRIALYVCMSPRSKASDEVLKQRENAYEDHISTSHWPHYFQGHRPPGLNKEGKLQVVPHKMELTPRMRELIGRPLFKKSPHAPKKCAAACELL